MPKEDRIMELEKLFYGKFFEREKDKILYFALTYGKDFLLVKSGTGDAEKAFLGYEWSKKRGHEGMKIISDGLLFDCNNRDNNRKISYYINREMMSLENKWFDDSVSGYLSRSDFFDAMDFTSFDFNKRIKLSKKEEIIINTKWPLKKLGDITNIYNGGTPSTTIKEYWDGGIPWVTLVDTKGKFLYKTARTISDEGLKNSNAKLLPVDTVLFSSRATIGSLSIAKVETTTNQGYKNFICNKNIILPEYLYYILEWQAKNIESIVSGTTYKEVSKKVISDYKIPLPPLDIQNKIISAMVAAEGQQLSPDKIEEGLAMIRKEKLSILDKYLK